MSSRKFFNQLAPTSAASETTGKAIPFAAGSGHSHTIKCSTISENSDGSRGEQAEQTPKSGSRSSQPLNYPILTTRASDEPTEAWSVAHWS